MARPKANTPAGKIASEKFRKTMRKKYGEKWLEHYKEIGSKGGKNGHTGGFASNIALAKVAGSKGGRHGRRGLKFIREEDGFCIYEDKLGGEIRYEA